MNTPPPLEDDARFQLGVISGKLDLILTHQREEAARNTERFARAEGRLDAAEDAIVGLQKDRAWLLGGAAAIGAGLSGIATWIGFK